MRDMADAFGIVTAGTCATIYNKLRDQYKLP